MQCRDNLPLSATICLVDIPCLERSAILALAHSGVPIRRIQCPEMPVDWQCESISQRSL